jgi:hypothetical protein
VTLYVEEFDGVDCRLSYEKLDWLESHTARVGDKIVLGYLVRDDTGCDVDDLIGDCMGGLYSFHRYASHDQHMVGYEALGLDRNGERNLDIVYERHTAEFVRRYIELVTEKHPLDEIVARADEEEFERSEGELDDDYARRALAYETNYECWGDLMFYDTAESVLQTMWEDITYFPGNKDAVLLDVYEHSGQCWSISGRGMQCGWDTARGAGVWAPDKYLSEQLDADEAKGLDRASRRKVYCRQFLDNYNDVINGNVFGVIVEWFDEHGTPIESDECWGHVGSSYAEESLKGGFDWRIKTLQTEYDAAVHTQDGKQVEIAWTPEEEEAWTELK